MNYKELKGKIITNELALILNMRLDHYFEALGLSIDEYNNSFKNISTNTEDKREAISKISDHLTLYLEENYGIKLPYCYHGCRGEVKSRFDYLDIEDDRDFYGLNPSIGTPIRSCYSPKDMGILNFYYGYDCSSIIMLIHRLLGIEFYNKTASQMSEGFIKEHNDEFYLPHGKIYTMGDINNENIKINEIMPEIISKYNYSKYPGNVGDLIFDGEHVMLITDIDHNNGIITTLEEKNIYDGLVRSEFYIHDLIAENRCLLVDTEDFLNNPDHYMTPYSINEYVKERNFVKK